MKDRIVQRVISQFEDRSSVGIKKYGTTLCQNDKDDFLQHLKEKLMDAVLYIEKLQDESTNNREQSDNEGTYTAFGYI